MGGQALLAKGIETRRVDDIEYNSIQLEIEYEFTTAGYITYVTPAYYSKKDFGDLDIMLMIDGDQIERLRHFIEITFKPNVIVSNGNVISFDYRNFQIDIIKIRAIDWVPSKIYFSYDPIGNVMGKIAHKFGLKYGHDGLTYPYRSASSNVMGDILLSRFPTKIFNFLGYNLSEFKQGFLTIENIFDYLMYGTYFDKEIFQFSNLNAIDKKRNRKRPSYNKFLEYVDKTDNHGFQHKWKDDKLLYIPDINKAFPEAHFIERYFELVVKEKTLKKIKTKFNGDEIMKNFPDLQGKELGAMMNKFRHGHTDFDNYVLDNTSEQILLDFEQFRKDLELKKL